MAVFFFLSIAAIAHSQGPEDNPKVRISPSDNPAAETVFIPPSTETPAARPDPAWYVKTGVKKGLSGRAKTSEEQIAAADVAVLARGYYAPWQDVLAEFQEPVVMIGFGDVAGIIGTKPLLIIPTGALSGTEGSDFFKAGLAEYARSGGTIFCLAQRNGSDFSALPVPEDQRIRAAGWSEDAGPLYRASSIQRRHPLVSHQSGTMPSIETDGYLTARPAEAQVLLARPDGFPTAVVYPFGTGWVVVTSLFSDFSSLLGNPEHDEKTLIHDLLSWARKHPRPVARAGQARVLTANTGPDPLSSDPGQSSIIRPLRPAVRPTMTRNGDMIRIVLAVSPVPQLTGRRVIARAAGQEKTITLAQETNQISFDIPAATGEQRITYALYDENSKALARGFLTIPAPRDKNVILDKTYYLPGETASVKIADMGQGELTLSGVGFFNNQIINDRGNMTVPIPANLPAGAYPLHWVYEDVHGVKKHGTLVVNIAGYRVALGCVSIEKKFEGRQMSATATFRIQSMQKVSGRLTVALRSPEGKTNAVAEQVLSLIEGEQTVPVTFSSAPGESGIWELISSLDVTLPQGAGIPAGPTVIASDSTLFDVGAAAVLAVATGKPLYYETSGAVTTTAYIYGQGQAAIEVRMDNKPAATERIELAGAYRFRTSFQKLKAGPHTIRVTATEDALESVKERPFTYGALSGKR